MDDLVAWLRAQLDEDERVAHDAEVQPPPDDPRAGVWTYVVTPGGDYKVVDYLGYSISGHYDVDSEPWSTGPHIALHDPASVMREVEAKRRLIEEIGRYEEKIDGEWGCCHSSEGILAGRCPEVSTDQIQALRIMALPYADRPGYRQEWAPDAQKP